MMAALAINALTEKGPLLRAAQVFGRNARERGNGCAKVPCAHRAVRPLNGASESRPALTQKLGHTSQRLRA